MRQWMAWFLVIGLALAPLGCGGDTSSSSSSGGGDDPVITGGVGDMSIPVARVGDRKILAGAVYAHMIKMMGEERANLSVGNPDVLSTAISALLDQFVWAEIARREGIELPPEDQARVDAFAAELLTNRYMQEVFQPKILPSREEVQAYYNENQEKYMTPTRVGARHILVDSMTRAQELKALVEGGASFPDLARQHSLDEQSRDLGGALGFIQEGVRIRGLGQSTAFEDAVLPLEEGEMAIVRSHLGFHLVMADKVEPGTLIPIQQVYDEISGELGVKVWATVYNEELNKAREATGARFIEAGVEQFTGVNRNVDRIMADAIAMDNPEMRVEMLRRVVFDFPEHERAPEAQFRIAYTLLVDLDKHQLAKKALTLLERKFGQTEWLDAGKLMEKYVHDHTHDLDEVLGTPEELLEKAKAGK